MDTQRQNDFAETLTPHETAPSVNNETLQNERKQNQYRVIGSFHGA